MARAIDVGELVAGTAAQVGALPVRSAASVRALRVALSRKLRGASPDEVIAAAHELKARKLDWMAWELVYAHKPTLMSLDIASVEAMGQGMASWPESDGFGMILAGPAWLHGRIGDADVERWARSDDLWWRRAALVATTALNNKSRGGRGDTPRTLAIVEMLIDDREDMIVKAVSWALRMLAPWDSAAVRAFMARHGDRLAPRIRREVRSKLETGLKSPRR
jgi:hypothetical protein